MHYPVEIVTMTMVNKINQLVLGPCAVTTRVIHVICHYRHVRKTFTGLEYILTNIINTSNKGFVDHFTLYNILIIF